MKLTNHFAIAFVAVTSVFAGHSQAGCGPQLSGQSGAQKAAVNRIAQSFARMKALSRVTGRPRLTGDATTLPTMTGLWMTTFTVDGQVVDAGFDAWNSDGTQILNDNPPPSSGNVCLGVWVKTGDLTYQLKHPSWAYDETGNLIGVSYILEKITLDAGGNSFQGALVFDGYDLDGNQVFHSEGEVSGDRITVDVDPPASSGN